MILGGIFGLEWWIEGNFEAQINKQDTRAYDIKYKGFDVHSFFTGISLEDVSIVPILMDSGSVVNGKARSIEISGFQLSELLLNKRLYLDRIVFVNPSFELINFPKRRKKSGSKGLQNLFADILSRASLNDFLIEDGSLLLKNGATGQIKGKWGKINLTAKNIETDTLVMKYVIPFDLENLVVSIDTAFFHLNEHATMHLGYLGYNLKEGNLKLNELSLVFNKAWQTISKSLGIQEDIVDFNLKELEISNMDFKSSVLSELNIHAGVMRVNSLNMRLHRNLNLDRPPDIEKPMFKGMIDLIPFNLNIDTIQILNSQLSYTELGKNKTQEGTIRIQDISGKILGVNTGVISQTEESTIRSNLKASINGNAPMQVKLEIPYDKEHFTLNVMLSSKDLRKLNTSLLPMAGVEIKSGRIQNLQFLMMANSLDAANSLIMDYDSLSISVLKTEGTKMKKRGLMSKLANAAIRTSNKPGNKRYLKADYTSERNIYRAPFKFIVESLLKGIVEIVPSKGAKKVIKSKKKKEMKKKVS